MPRYIIEVDESINNCCICPMYDCKNEWCNLLQKNVDSDILRPLNCPLQLVDDKGQKQADAFSWN